MGFQRSGFRCHLAHAASGNSCHVAAALIGTPIAWWLTRTDRWLKGPISALVALPLVLPPTVLGFYLLLAMGPNGPVGQLTQSMGLGLLPFTFWGLVVASVFYSMPFVVQPIQNAFDAIGERPLEVAARLCERVHGIASSRSHFHCQSRA